MSMTPNENRDTVAERWTQRVAALVLAGATGLPLRSAKRLLPSADDKDGPYVGL